MVTRPVGGSRRIRGPERFRCEAAPGWHGRPALPLHAEKRQGRPTVWKPARFGLEPRAQVWTRRSITGPWTLPLSRTAEIHRVTTETDIRVGLLLDGVGKADIATGIGFLDHMLTAFARHALFDLSITGKGDLEIDAHHTTEDVGIVLGQALGEALGEKRGICRFGQALVPMDEALVEAAVDLSGRAHLSWAVAFPTSRLGSMETELFREFFSALAANALLTLHLSRRAGENSHHLAEATFKATARALRMAVALEPRLGDAVPSTKGRL